MYGQNKKHSELGGRLMIEPFQPGKDTGDGNVYSGTCSHPSSTRIEVTSGCTLMNSKEELKFIIKKASAFIFFGVSTSFLFPILKNGFVKNLSRKIMNLTSSTCIFIHSLVYYEAEKEL